jgi:hypothetical protein
MSTPPSGAVKIRSSGTLTRAGRRHLVGQSSGQRHRVRVVGLRLSEHHATRDLGHRPGHRQPPTHRIDVGHQPADGLRRVGLEQRLARAAGLLHVGQHQRRGPIRDEAGDLRTHVPSEHLRLGEGVEVGRCGPGGDVLHVARADGEAGQTGRSVGGDTAEKRLVDLPGDVPSQTRTDLGAGLRRGVLGHLGGDDAEAGHLGRGDDRLVGGEVADRDLRASATHAADGSAVTFGMRYIELLSRTTVETSGFMATEAARTGTTRRSSTCSGVRRGPAVPVVWVMRAGSEEVSPGVDGVILRATDPPVRR